MIAFNITGSVWQDKLTGLTIEKKHQRNHRSGNGFLI
jgi:hypothetical protein